MGRRWRPDLAVPTARFLPGRSPRPHAAASSPGDDSYVTPERWQEHGAYLWGVDLYNAGCVWEAHEAWEAAWNAAGEAGDEAQRQFLQGLIQCAAAAVKAALGEAAACRRLAERGLARLRGYERYMGLDVPAFVKAFGEWAAGEQQEPARPQLELV